MVAASSVTLRVLLAVACFTLARAGTAEAVFDAQRPQWTELHFSASKLLMHVDARVEAQLRSANQVTPKLLDTPEGDPVAAGSAVLEMTYAMTGLGRESLTRLWVDPTTGATLQRIQLDEGSRQRQRSYRFTDRGAYHYTRWPATEQEKKLPPEQWSRREQGIRAYPMAAMGKPVTEATALLWLIAAADIDRTGERFETLTFSRRHVNLVTAEVVGTRATRVDFTEQRGGKTTRRKGKVDALAVRLRGRPLEAAADEDEAFELLGLSGDLDMLLDPATRAPIELRGRVKIVGVVTIRLRRAILR